MMMMIDNNMKMKISTHRHNVFVVGGEGDAVDAVLVTRELGHAGLVLRVLGFFRGRLVVQEEEEGKDCIMKGGREGSGYETQVTRITQ